jgi:hypothetical protein
MLYFGGKGTMTPNRNVHTRKLAGWTAISLALFALVPSDLPGAISVFGLMFSLAALVLSTRVYQPRR